MAVMRHKEAIHSGHFMISDFEAEEEDEEDITAAVVVSPCGSSSSSGGGAGSDSTTTTKRKRGSTVLTTTTTTAATATATTTSGTLPPPKVIKLDRGRPSTTAVETTWKGQRHHHKKYAHFFTQSANHILVDRRTTTTDVVPFTARRATTTPPPPGGRNRIVPSYGCLRQGGGGGGDIMDVSLKRLLQSMSIAYRQKLTSPKWNRFRGLRLRWKDKIRLNNVIWRCWHMQFVKGFNNRRLLCQFANPLEIDHHSLVECPSIVSGKYWKRKLDTIKNEYMRWRLFYHAIYEEEEEEGIGGRRRRHLPAAVSCKLKKMVAALPFNPRKVWDRETSTPPAKSSTSSVSSSSSSAAENAAAVSGDVATTTAAAADDQWDALLKSSFNALVVEGSKDDAALDGMMLDEALFVDTFAAANGSGDGDDNSFWTSSGSTSNHQGVTMYDMGGDDYRNATNADFIQPGLPSLQPNLDDLGIIDFGGNVFNDHWPDDRTAETTCSQHQQVAGVQQFRSLATAAETPSFGRDGAAATTSPVVVNQQAPAPPVAAAYKSHSPKYRVLKQWEPVPPCSSGVTKAGGVNYSVPSSRFVAPPPQQKPTPRRRPDSDGVPAARRRGNDDETKSGSKSNPELVQLLKENGNLSTRRRPQNPGFGSGDPDAKFGMSSSVVVVDGGQTTFGFPSRDDDGGGGGEALLKWQLFNHQQMEQQQRHKLLLEQRQRMLDEQRRQIERKLLEQQEMEERRKRTVEQQQHLKLMEERKRQRLRPGSGKIPPPKVSDVQQQRLLRCLNNNNTDVGSMRPPSSPWAEAAAAAGVQQRPGLKSGFEVLRRLIPSLNTGDPQNDNCKISKAALLHKAGDHLKRLKTERANDLLEVKATRDAIARLKEDVALLQRRLPHGGAVGEEPAAGGRNKVRRMFGRHAAEAATGANWKYWVFAALVGPLADSFERASLGSPRNFEHASRNAMVWIDQSCSLPNLRCVLVDALTKLSLDTAILDDPGAFAQEVVGKAAASLLAEMEEDVETNPGSGNSSKRDNDNNGFEQADARILYN